MPHWLLLLAAVYTWGALCGFLGVLCVLCPPSVHFPHSVAMQVPLQGAMKHFQKNYYTNAVKKKADRHVVQNRQNNKIKIK